MDGVVTLASGMPFNVNPGQEHGAHRPAHPADSDGRLQPGESPELANPLLPNFAVDFLQNGIDPATNRGLGSLPLNATPDVGTGNPFPGGGGPRAIQLSARLGF